MEGLPIENSYKLSEAQRVSSFLGVCLIHGPKLSGVACDIVAEVPSKSWVHILKGSKSFDEDSWIVCQDSRYFD